MGDILNNTVNLGLTDDVPSEYLLIVCLILTVEIVLGVTGNIVVLWAYYRYWSMLRSVSNILMANLNVVDILVCLMCVPLTFTSLLLRHREINVFVCGLHEAAVSFACSATALCLLVISMDRYESVIKPTKRSISAQNVRYVLSVPWLGALLGFGVAFIYITNHSLVKHIETGSCVPWFSTTQTRNYYQTYWILLFLISSIWMVVSYRKIVEAAHARLSVKAALFQATLMVAGSGICEQKALPTGTRATKVALAIVSTYILCWGPYTAYRLAVIIKPELILETVHFSLLCLAYMTTIFHPLLYAFLRRNIREACRNLVLPRERIVRTIQVAPYEST